MKRKIAGPRIADAAFGGRQQQQRVHGLAGSKLCASRGRFGVSPSIQSVSELTWKNGALAEQRQRLDHAAAGVEQEAALVGDHDARLFALGEVPFDLVGEVMHVDHRGFDAGGGELVEHMVDQRLAGDLAPAASACVSVSGRMRVPRPAASTMALRGVVIATSAPARWRGTSH